MNLIKEEKEVFQIIFLDDKALGIKDGEWSVKNERPCIIIQINDDGSGEVLSLTTKKNTRYPQLKLETRITSEGKTSYLNLNSSKKLISSTQLRYAEVSKTSLSNYDHEAIKKHFNLF